MVIDPQIEMFEREMARMIEYRIEYAAYDDWQLEDDPDDIDRAFADAEAAYEREIYSAAYRAGQE